MKAVGRPENQKGQTVIQGLLKGKGFASIPTKIREGVLFDEIGFMQQLEIKPFGLEFENSRCLFTEFASLVGSDPKKFQK